jgi:hypothetical protein
MAKFVISNSREKRGHVKKRKQLRVAPWAIISNLEEKIKMFSFFLNVKNIYLYEVSYVYH